MKKLLATLKEIAYNVWYWRRYFKAKSYERKIRRGILDKEKEKISVMIAAKLLIPKKTKKGLSKFIPLDIPTNAEVKAMILYEYGYKMKVLGMKITDDLKFI